MSKELVFGHKSPDTDAISCAIEYAYLANKLGDDVEAVALGTPNDETKFVLDYFNVDAPRVITNAKPEVDSVVLVDHNEAKQSVDDLADVTVTRVIDHHKIDFQSAQPLYYRAEPVGCCSTIIYKMFLENDVVIPREIAGLMLSSIISDTLLLKSPTTTDEERQAVPVLAKLAGIDDYETYGIEMLKAGTNVAARSAEDILQGDAKTYEMGGKNLRIGQVNTVDLEDVLSRKDELEAEMKTIMAADGYDMFLLLATNVLTSDSVMLVLGDPINAIEEAYNAKVENNLVNLPGVVSRKKQVIPPLQAVLG
ncbi:manganese-dependent inorganic pyrophosphatase [Lentilactobacillus kribbianus]|uniref:manganese-dependent inorganic pyrophosphatase n=1 Tax=Lentilactobacillus kribbianus TaxID=2729622 RepID=UPI0015518644|nr:manganese-dependent inorganic pyrophosphatase [Lentilactobacillus kribbianus]